MKNLLKTGFVALVIAVSFSACGGDAKKVDGDTTKVDSTVIVDSTVKVDSTIKKDTAKTDTVKKDSVKK